MNKFVLGFLLGSLFMANMAIANPICSQVLLYKIRETLDTGKPLKFTVTVEGLGNIPANHTSANLFPNTNIEKSLIGSFKKMLNSFDFNYKLSGTVRLYVQRPESVNELVIFTSNIEGSKLLKTLLEKDEDFFTKSYFKISEAKIPGFEIRVTFDKGIPSDPSVQIFTSSVAGKAEFVDLPTMQSFTAEVPGQGKGPSNPDYINELPLPTRLEMAIQNLRSILGDAKNKEFLIENKNALTPDQVREIARADISLPGLKNAIDILMKIDSELARFELIEYLKSSHGEQVFEFLKSKPLTFDMIQRLQFLQFSSDGVFKQRIDQLLGTIVTASTLKSLNEGKLPVLEQLIQAFASATHEQQRAMLKALEKFKSPLALEALESFDYKKSAPETIQQRDSAYSQISIASWSRTLEIGRGVVNTSTTKDLLIYAGSDHMPVATRALALFHLEQRQLTSEANPYLQRAYALQSSLDVRNRAFHLLNRISRKGY